MNRELEDLLALTARLVPGLAGQVAAGSGPGIRPGADNAQAIAGLRDIWRQRHPEAGPHYLALRCWGLLIWQPVYLSVIAAHRSAIVPDLSSMSLPVPDDGFIIGYTLPPHAPWRADPCQRIHTAAAQLRTLCAGFYGELSRALRISARAAESMQADCVLQALLAARRDHGACANAWAQRQAGLWLDLLGLQGRSGYLSYERASLPRIAVDRQVCCHDFRKRDGDYCSTCPKLDLADRMARIDAEHAEAA